MDGIHSTEAGKGDAEANVSLFLGLFLLVLAFFIVLVSISTLEETRSRQVMDSLTSTFSELIEPVENTDPFLGQHGDFLEPEAFQAEIADVFVTAISVVKIRVIKPGREMRVEMSTRQIFDDGSFELRAVRTPLIDRVVSSLSRNPPNIRFQTQVMFAIPEEDASDIDRQRRIALRRADALARYLVERGAPPETVSAGVFKGEPEVVRFNFFIRRDDDLIADFSKAVSVSTVNGSTGVDLEP